MSIFEGIIIEANSKYISDPAFTNKIKQAISLLKSKASHEFSIMTLFIKKISAAAASGANFNGKEMTIDIAKDTFNASLPWLASVLIHETQHIKKYKDTGKKFGDAHKIKDKKEALQVMINEELECNRIQLVVLKKVGGEEYEITYLKAQKGDHFDIDRDGDYDADDYNNRTW